MIRAKGLSPLALASPSDINKQAAAPSDNVDAFPAVTVPFSLWKTVANFVNLSKLTFLYSSSSEMTSGGLPLFCSIDTGTAKNNLNFQFTTIFFRT